MFYDLNDFVEVQIVVIAAHRISGERAKHEVMKDRRSVVQVADCQRDFRFYEFVVVLAASHAVATNHHAATDHQGLALQASD